jgi:hypothetical protein
MAHTPQDIPCVSAEVALHLLPVLLLKFISAVKAAQTEVGRRQEQWAAPVYPRAGGSPETGRRS